MTPRVTLHQRRYKNPHRINNCVKTYKYIIVQLTGTMNNTTMGTRNPTTDINRILLTSHGNPAFFQTMQNNPILNICVSPNKKRGSFISSDGSVRRYKNILSYCNVTNYCRKRTDKRTWINCWELAYWRKCSWRIWATKNS